jgi:hypothetical protein
LVIVAVAKTPFRKSYTCERDCCPLAIEENLNRSDRPVDAVHEVYVGSVLSSYAVGQGSSPDFSPSTTGNKMHALGMKAIMLTMHVNDAVVTGGFESMIIVERGDAAYGEVNVSDGLMFDVVRYNSGENTSETYKWSARAIQPELPSVPT